MRALLIVVLGSLLSACAHHVTSVRSSWYVVQEANASVTYIAIVNQGNRTIYATEVILNPLRDRVFSRNFHSAWHLVFEPPEAISPGKTLFIKADQFVRGAARFGACMIPIEIDLRIAGRDSLVPGQLDVAMPNSVPTGWETECVPKTMPRPAGLGAPDGNSAEQGGDEQAGAREVFVDVAALPFHKSADAVFFVD